MASVKTTGPGKRPVVAKPIAPTLKPSTSQTSLKKSSSSTAAPTRSAKTPTAPPPKKEQPPPAPIQDATEEVEPEPEPEPRIRSGSYTISRPATTPTDQNRNVVDKDKTPTAGGRVASGIQGQALGSLVEFQRNIDRRVMADGKLGILRYVGLVDFMEGVYCGIEFDQPIGLHDGEVDGKRYFKTGFRRATFVAIDHVRFVEEDQRPTSTMSKTVGVQEPPLWNDGDELLQDVQPNLADITLNDSIMNASATTYDLTESLLFLKGSRFPGMDVSMTPSELMEQLFHDRAPGGGGGGGGGGESEAELEGLSESPAVGNLVDIDSPRRPDTRAGPNLQEPVAKSGDSVAGSSRGGANAALAAGPRMAIAAETSGLQASSSAVNTIPVIHPHSNIGSAALIRAVKGFETMSIVVHHYAHTIVPELQRELMEAQRQSANQANDNLQLQEHCTMLERRQREYEKKMRQFQNAIYEAKSQKMVADMRADEIKKLMLEAKHQRNIVADLQEQLVQAKRRNEILLMGKEELEYKLSESVYCTPASRVFHDESFKTPSATSPAKTRRRSRSLFSATKK